MAKFMIIHACADCPNSKVLPDPDPLDSFCFDDVKVVCTVSNGRAIAVGCRPYNARKEAGHVPAWCPLTDAPSGARNMSKSSMPTSSAVESKNE